LTRRKWTAVALAFAGTVLVAKPTGLGTSHITAVGLLISLGAAIAYAGITLFTKKLTKRYDAWTILVYAFGFAALALLPFQIGRPFPTAISGQAWVAFAGLVLITTIVGYTLYATALKHLQASVASIAAMSEVPFAAFFGYIFLGERIQTWQVFGAVLVVSGVILLSIQPRPRPNAEEGKFLR
jgi:drug/metabolite transporter (DMT)-like permease